MKKPPGIFITGTDTDIGKTLISALLLLGAHIHDEQACYFKPIQTGTDLDCATIQKLTHAPATAIIQPRYAYPAPLAPYQAAKQVSQSIDIDSIVSFYQDNLFQNPAFCIVEGAGGLLVPIAKNTVIRDLIKKLGLPILVVASTRLGTINHTLLTLEAARTQDIPITGIVLCGPENSELISVFSEFTEYPVLIHIPWLEDFSKDTLHHWGRKLWTAVTTHLTHHA